MFLGKHLDTTSLNRSHNNVDILMKCHCKHGGTCAPGGKCRCRTGFTGKRCETPICRPECMNGGVCVDANVCHCMDGYTGARCQKGTTNHRLYLCVSMTNIHCNIIIINNRNNIFQLFAIRNA